MLNNAGLMPSSMLDKLMIDEWDRMIDVNIKGVLYGIAKCLEFAALFAADEKLHVPLDALGPYVA